MFPKVTVMSSPNQSTAAPNSGRSQGIFDAALSHGKDPMKIFEEQLSEDSSELSRALWNTLRHICTEWLANRSASPQKLKSQMV